MVLVLHILTLLIALLAVQRGESTSCKQSLENLPLALDDVVFVLHRNGEPQHCGVIASSVADMVKNSPDCDAFDIYILESFLTDYFAAEFADNGPSSCGSLDDPSARSGLAGFCDMGPDRTVIQKDHKFLVPISSGTLPCRWFTREGLHISTLEQLAQLAETALKRREDSDCRDDDGDEECFSRPSVQLYGVPAGRVFMFAPSFVGETFAIDHVQDAEGKPLTMEVLSVNPRVFDIHNFFNKEESDSLVQNALQQTDETFGFHRSTTGTDNKRIFSKRTSENAWDTSSPSAMTVKERCFRLLGFDEYQEPLSDGLQILRYNLTTAYVPHMDYLENNAQESYNYDSSGVGGNRFATILLYFTELGEHDGGETVFPRAWPNGERVELADAIEQLRQGDQGGILKQGSWEEEMTAECRSRFAVRPKAQRAVLFYSQFPNGKQDPMSFHGGCPVLNGTKLGANLWTWSGIRPEYSGAPRKFDEGTKELKAVFRNTGKDDRFRNADVFYNDDVFFGKLGFEDDPVYVNTYKGHRWTIKVGGKTLKTFYIDGSPNQTFEV